MKNASEDFLNYLTRFYNSCVSHCYLPVDILKGIITPIVKDIKGNLTKPDNYRPIMQSSCLLKVFEMIMLNILDEKNVNNARQFGFRKGMSTTDCCFLLKEILYKNCKTKKSCIVAFIDFSKVFDKVDHFILGDKLLRL